LSESTSHNVLVVTYWSFNDALVQAYTLPYVREIKKLLPKGSTIDLVTLEPNHTEIENLRKLKDPDFNILAFPYSSFGVRTIFKLSKIIKQLKHHAIEKKVKTIHCWCTPGGAIGYLIHRKTGIRLVLDSFEPHAESMVENGTWTKGGLPFKLLFRLEKKQAQAAEHLIGLTPKMRNYSSSNYNVDPKHFYVKPACTDLQLFSKNKYPNIRHELGILPKDVVCVYAGKVGGIYLDDEIFIFWKICNSLFDSFKVIFLTNYDDDAFEAKLMQHNLSKDLFVKRFVPHKEVPLHLAQANFALNPVRPVPTKRYCTSIKDGEYWAMGLPVVITKGISDDSQLIEESQAGVVIQDLSYDGLTAAANAIKSLLSSRVDYQERCRELADKHRNINHQIPIYATIYSK